jgi:serine/threonine protein kinase
MNVREIEKDGVLYIVKFATSKEKQFLLEDEIRNHKLIQSKNVPGILNIEHEDGFNLVTRKVSGLFGHFNLRSLLFSNCNLHDLLFREILFQICFSIGILQFSFQSFRHNDLKADNILLDTSHESSEFIFEWPNPKRHWKLNSGIKTYIIDFEVSSSNDFNNNKSLALEKAHSKFGLSAERCDMFDIHLLFSELRMSAPHKVWGASFLAFSQDFFNDKMFSSDVCTSQFRLNFQAQKQSMTLRWKRDNFIFRILSHQYFSHLRVQL